MTQRTSRTERAGRRTRRVSGTVRGAHVLLPDDVRLPDGLRVTVSWREAASDVPYDREPLTADDVKSDLAWARRGDVALDSSC